MQDITMKIMILSLNENYQTMKVRFLPGKNKLYI